jgi:hypothetical protein
VSQKLRFGGDVPFFVGASLLAKNVNDDADILNVRGAFRFFASRLAPTGIDAASPQAARIGSGIEDKNNAT